MRSVIDFEGAERIYAAASQTFGLWPFGPRNFLFLAFRFALRLQNNFLKLKKRVF